MSFIDYIFDTFNRILEYVEALLLVEVHLSDNLEKCFARLHCLVGHVVPCEEQGDGEANQQVAHDKPADEKSQRLAIANTPIFHVIFFLLMQTFVCVEL